MMSLYPETVVSQRSIYRQKTNSGKRPPKCHSLLKKVENFLPWEIAFNKYITVTWRRVKRSDHGGQAVTKETGTNDSLMKIELFSARNDNNPVDIQGYPALNAITILIMPSWLLSGSLRFVSPTVDPAVIKVNQVHIIPYYPVTSTLTYKQFSQVSLPLRFSD